MIDDTNRNVSWIKAARKEFERFPTLVQLEIRTALTVIAEGRKPGLAKPVKGMGSGVFEIALRYQTDAYRVIYAVQIEEDIWVVHAFKKKSKSGIKTPKHEMDVAHQRIKNLKEILS